MAGQSPELARMANRRRALGSACRVACNPPPGQAHPDPPIPDAQACGEMIHSIGAALSNHRMPRRKRTP